MKDTWDYRVVRKITEKDISSAGDVEQLSVQEVYYDDDGETPTAHTIDLQVSGDSITDLRNQIQRMLWCLDKEIMDEIESEFTNETIEDRILYLENEIEDIRDVVSEFDNRVTRSVH